MELVQKLENIRDHNGHIRQYGIFMCPACGRTIEKRLDAGLKSYSCGFHYHNMRWTKTYSSWSAMLHRCFRKKHPHYWRYGGSGITVCSRWMNFKEFLYDMGEMPDDKSCIDRIDTSKGYYRENCRWATYKENNNNMVSNKVLTYNGNTMTMSQWAENCGIKYTTFRERLSRGWSLEKTIETKVKKRRNNGRD